MKVVAAEAVAGSDGCGYGWVGALFVRSARRVGGGGDALRRGTSSCAHRNSRRRRGGGRACQMQRPRPSLLVAARVAWPADTLPSPPLHRPPPPRATGALGAVEGGIPDAHTLLLAVEMCRCVSGSIHVPLLRGVGVFVWKGGAGWRPEGGGGGGAGSAPTDGTLRRRGKREKERRRAVEAGRKEELAGGREDKARRPARGTENKARGRAGGRVDDIRRPAGRRVLETRGPAGGFWEGESGADATPLSPLQASVAVDLLNALHDVDVDHVPPVIL